MRHGDAELTRLNYVVYPDESIGPHTRVDIANGAAEEIQRLRARVAELESQLADRLTRAYTTDHPKGLDTRGVSAKVDTEG